MQVRKSDVLVIGSGGAGVMAAVEAARAGASVTIVSKEPLGYGDTRIALGVMSTSPDTASGDSEEAFVEDMIRGGEYLNDPKLVRALVADAMDATLTFEGFGHVFSRDPEGVLRRMPVPPGGHRASRAISSPWLGVSMSHAMRAAVARSGIEVLEETVCSELLVHDGEVVGAVAHGIMTGELFVLPARSTVVAAGGAGAAAVVSGRGPHHSRPAARHAAARQCLLVHARRTGPQPRWCAAVPVRRSGLDLRPHADARRGASDERGRRWTGRPGRAHPIRHRARPLSTQAVAGRPLLDGALLIVVRR